MLIIRRIILSLSVICSMLSPLLLSGMQDTLYSCNPGEPVLLETDSIYEAYLWSPTLHLNNPTVPNPIASPNQTTTYTLEAITASGENLILNGDFSAGNSEFSSSYIYSPGTNPTQGVYGIFSDAATLSPQYFSNCTDHTNGIGNMMVVDGAPQANVTVWCQTINIDSFTNYAFSTWVTSINPANPAALQFSINDIQLGGIFNAGGSVCQWREFYAIWNSGPSTQAEICIVNQNIDPNGNDFALDDFAFFKLGEIIRDTITLIVRSSENTEIDTAVCAGMTVEFNGEELPADTSVIFNYSSIYGCDSLVTIHVGILDTIYKQIIIDTLCPGDSLIFFGHTIVHDTFICVTRPISESCDSTICLTAVFLTQAAVEGQIEHPLCRGDPNGSIKINVEAGLPPYSFDWSNGSTTSDISGIYAGTYQVTIMDSKGCMVQKSFELKDPEELFSNSTGTSSICNADTNGMLLFDAVGGTPPYEFSIDNGTVYYSQSLLDNLSLGTYSVLVRDNNGCVAEEIIEIIAPEPVNLFLPDNSTISLGETVQVEISHNSPIPLIFDWSPQNGVACASCAITEISPIQTTTYVIVATDSLGCSIESEWTIEVEKNYLVYVPNVFTPNGDGINDRFSVYPGIAAAKIISFQVFDRWGNLYFQAENCNPGDQICEWDGTMEGQVVGPGVFVYQICVEYIDGNKEKFEGSLFLMM